MGVWEKPVFEIDTKVLIVVGHDKDKYGLYKGIKNNSNWHMVQVEDNGIVHLNKEEFVLA